MKQDHSSDFVNITGSVFMSITLILGIFLAVSFSNEEKTNCSTKSLDPNKYWDESICSCLAEEELPKPPTAVFLTAQYFSGR